MDTSCFKLNVFKDFSLKDFYKRGCVFYIPVDIAVLYHNGS